MSKYGYWFFSFQANLVDQFLKNLYYNMETDPLWQGKTLLLDCRILGKYLQLKSSLPS